MSSIKVLNQDKVVEAWVNSLITPAGSRGGGSDDADIEVPDIVDWAHEHFYIEETRRPIVLMPVQQTVLRMATERREDGRFKWTTVFYSTVKKSGKTTIAGLYQLWACETWGPYGEIYHMGNKQSQAKERAFKFSRMAIELAPKRRRQEWDIRALRLTHEPTHSYIEALPVNAAGAAGGNQNLTTWTEMHGYQYEEHEKMWNEMQPVPTRLRSQRFVESYAGYIGVSTLLKRLWDQGLEGERLHDEYPIFGNEKTGLLAYIDTGVEARRMPWQQGEAGERYYAQQEAQELPHEFRRIHLNEWVSSQNQLFDIEMWDRLFDAERAYVGAAAWETREVDAVLGVDASVSGDCTAVQAVGWDKELNCPVALETVIIEPPYGGKIDYETTLKPAIERLLKRWRVVEVAYDEYQLHYFMVQLKQQIAGEPGRNPVFYPFSQAGERLKADTQLVTWVRQGEFVHGGDVGLRQHLENADGKVAGDDAIRMVKREDGAKIDAAVCLSMGAWRSYQRFGQSVRATRTAKVRYAQKNKRRDSRNHW